MKRLFTFYLAGSWRSDELKAHTLKQAYEKTKKLIEAKRLVDPINRKATHIVNTNGLVQYQTCPLGGYVFSGWKTGVIK